MILFVYGADDYSSSRHVKTLRAHFESKYDPSKMNVDVVTVDKKTEIGTVASLLKSPGFLSDRRLVIVKNLLTEHSTKPAAEPWLQVMKTIPTENVVVIHDDLSDKKAEKHHLFKSLQGLEGVHAYHFPEQTAGSMLAWAKTEVARLKLNISPTLLQKVVSASGTDLWQLSNELKKLAGYFEGRAVDQAGVDKLIIAGSEDAMFDLMDAISEKHTKKALALLRAQRDAGSNDFQLFSMLARQIRLLASARSVMESSRGATKQDIAQSLGIHPFVAQKLLQQGRNGSFAQASAWHKMVFRFDNDVKNGKRQVDAAVDRLVAEMIA